jgi:Uma2 family endonuclease
MKLRAPKHACHSAFIHQGVDIMLPRLMPISVDDYLAGEAQGPRKHEYVDGEIYAMAGASRRHNVLASNIHVRAGNAAHRTPNCQVFGSDMKVYVETRNSFYYPDLSACCDPTDRNEQFLARPCFIVEVLSPSTASIDRREKRPSYETIPSLREYVIVEQNRMRVDVYRRRGERWEVEALFQPNDVVESSCLGLRLTLGDIYQGVDLPIGMAEPDPADDPLVWASLH